jgi:GNAT superfamily N-acetyltransferase
MIAGDFLPESLYRSVCRPALPKDTPEVMQLTRTIWEGEDYVPYVWEDWLADPKGLLVIIEFGGRVVGLGKLTQFSDIDWWMEGLRVHPDYERRGIATHLHHFVLDYWYRNGSGIIRLVTASYNKPVHHICEHTGFQKLVEFTPYLAPTIESGAREQNEIDFVPLDESQVEKVIDIALSSPTLALSAGLIDLGWQWTTPSIDNIRQAIMRRHAFGWKKQKGVLLISEDIERTPRTSTIALIACPKEDLPEILLDYRKLAGQLEFKQAGWVAPLDPGILPVLKQAGFHRDWDGSLYIFEKRHPNF